ncbi:MAG: mannose-1-phosphate guanylyltransferase/mannose-6-phosphate isomerase [Proteobacteria bacterium]|nr:mannose-1-phosphate guanylyltransferase/mannose-6-phosphate isomerase [Pseudomonadota bacterium]
MKIDAQPVVMAGGSGTRLWPLSRAGCPKQFLVLSGDQSLFQQATQRLLNARAADIEMAAPLIVGNAEHRFVALEQLREMGQTEPWLVLEPAGRNTAPALTLAALQASEGGADPVLVVTPADQTVADGTVFTTAVQRAVREAADGAIVILGVAPDRPETGYGYIRCDVDVFTVAEFKEKPDAQTAARYVADGHYYWNSGMFVLRASTWLKALAHFEPAMLKAVETAWAGRKVDGRFVRPDGEAFAAVPSESVDYAVIERCPGSRFPIRMVPLNAGWNDLGAWDAVWQAGTPDERGNVTRGDALLQDCAGTLVHSSGRLVAGVGLTDVVVVETADAVLVADRSRSQEVKAIVKRLSDQGRGEHLLHRKVERPWGWYDSIDMGPRFQVKRIVVKPGAALSLQMHHHRAEHWIVVSGTALVTRGRDKIMLSENQSTYIPLGETHRLENPGKVELEIIEVQSGSYLGEDDIVRFEDTYGRST